MINLLYFSWIRERIGRGDESIELPASIANAADLLDWLSSRDGGYKSALSERARLRIAINQDFASFDAPVRDGDEVAIFPPVTGG